MRGFIKATVLSAAVALVCAPSVARADGYVNPWAGVNFSSDFNSDTTGGFGVNAGYMGAGVIGGEVAFGFNPNFFNDTAFGNNNELDLMGNLIVGLPFGGTSGAGIRPYVTGGVGLIRTSFDTFDQLPLLDNVTNLDTSNNDWGWNVGAGAMGYFTDHVGVRGDIRYLRTFTNGDLTDLLLDLNGGNAHFWRTSFGLVIR